MSIYATWLVLDECEHEEDCGIWVESDPGCFEATGRCDCGRPRSPLVYEGSHVLPSDDDRRGGHVLACAIPDHITRDGRDDAPEGALKDWLRLSVGNPPSVEQRRGKPYVPGGQAVVVLDRAHVTELRDTLTAWLEREETA